MIETPFDDIASEDVQVFSHVDVTFTPSLKTVVSWGLKRSVPAGAGLFVVERSHYDEPFQVVAGPMDDNVAVVDGHMVASPDLDTVAWRVSYLIGGHTYSSLPVRGFKTFRKEDKGLLATVAHREAVTLERYAGVKGLFLKARTSGKPCPVCTDYGIETSARSACPNCFGTGHAGGFYNGRPWTIMFAGGPDTTKTSHPALGSIEPGNVVMTQAMNDYPAEANDVWIDLRNQERWVINAVKPEIVFKGVVVTVRMEMTRLQMSKAVAINNDDVSEKIQEPEKETDLWKTL